MVKRGIAFLVCLMFSATVLYFGVAPLIAALTISTGEPRLPFVVFGVINSILGIANLSVLLIVWRTPSPRIQHAAGLIGASIVIVALIGSLDHGGINGLEFAAIVGFLAIPALINWFAIRFLSRPLLP